MQVEEEKYITIEMLQRQIKLIQTANLKAKHLQA